MAYNKIIYNGNTLIDLTGIDTEAEHVLAGKTFVGNDGETGSGSMTNRGSATGTIATTNGSYTIQKGFHDGGGRVSISSVEAAKFLPGNIKNGVSLLGVQGNYTGEAPTLQTIAKSYTPSATTQSETVSAGTGYDAISTVTVTVAPIPYTESANTYGTTVTIG